FHLVLLRHKLRRERARVFNAQHGQRERLATSLTISRRRRVAIEFGTWRSGRSGGASGSITFGKGKSVNRDGHRGVMVEPTPSAPFEVAEPHFLLDLLKVVLDAPAQFGVIDQPMKADILWQS